jgi:hypothetical protein
MEKKELVKNIRLLVSKGQKANRETYLALAFARKMPYVVLEKTINEDKFALPAGAREAKMGLFCFLNGLAYTTSLVVERAENPDHPDKRPTGIYHEKVYEWMLEKYPVVQESSTSVAAE